MAYERKTPLMFDGPTPVDMAPAMAGFDPSTDRTPLRCAMWGPAAYGIARALTRCRVISGKPCVGSPYDPYGPFGDDAASSPGISPSTKKALALAGVGVLAYYFLLKKKG